MGFQRKTAIITGGGSGLGEAAAEAFAKAGAQVVICGRREEPLQSVSRRIEAAGGSVLAVQADVSREADVQRLLREAAARFGRVDILVNNAAVFELAQVAETSLESWNYQIATNLTGAFLMTRECLPFMRKQRFGRIVNITSSLARNGADGYAAYSASKAGLESLTRTTADEEGENNILVNMFNPGTIKSGMHATGQDPAGVVPALLELADLPDHSQSGRIITVK